MNSKSIFFLIAFFLFVISSFPQDVFDYKSSVTCDSLAYKTIINPSLLDYQPSISIMPYIFTKENSSEEKIREGGVFFTIYNFGFFYHTDFDTLNIFSASYGYELYNNFFIGYSNRWYNENNILKEQFSLTYKPNTKLTISSNFSHSLNNNSEPICLDTGFSYKPLVSKNIFIISALNFNDFEFDDSSYNVGLSSYFITDKLQVTLGYENLFNSNDDGRTSLQFTYTYSGIIFGSLRSQFFDKSSDHMVNFMQYTFKKKDK
ncbi:MAG TPA: hypothetical protein PLK90_05345 [Clostridiales bacterium]|nr:hypothetical protein [Clostridiales bacterium]HQP69806.1 hypothetical protein [Clostridiales bacterium]